MKRNAKNLKKYKEVCEEIYEECEGLCQKCGVFIREPKYHNFHHKKGRLTDKLGLSKENIIFVCYKDHCILEGQTPPQNWEWLDGIFKNDLPKDQSGYIIGLG